MSTKNQLSAQSIRPARVRGMHGRPFAGWTILGATLVVLAAGSSAMAGKIEIMALGDSVARGVGVVGGYRTELYQDLIKAGHSVQFDGSSTINLDTSFPDHHEGHSGYRIDQIAGNLLANDGSSGNDGGFWLKPDVQPNYIVLTVGENDFGQNFDITHAIDRLDGLISQITAARPQTRVLVSNLLPRTDLASAEQNAEKYFDPYVVGIVRKHAVLGELVSFLDLRSVMPATELSDGLHPTATGYNAIGDAVAQKIEQLQAQSSVPEPATAIAACGAAGLLIKRRRE